MGVQVEVLLAGGEAEIDRAVAVARLGKSGRPMDRGAAGSLHDRARLGLRFVDIQRPPARIAGEVLATSVSYEAGGGAAARIDGRELRIAVARSG